MSFCLSQLQENIKAPLKKMLYRLCALVQAEDCSQYSLYVEGAALNRVAGKVSSKQLVCLQGQGGIVFLKHEEDIFACIWLLEFIVYTYCAPIFLVFVYVCMCLPIYGHTYMCFLTKRSPFMHPRKREERQRLMPLAKMLVSCFQVCEDFLSPPPSPLPPPSWQSF